MSILMRLICAVLAGGFAFGAAASAQLNFKALKEKAKDAVERELLESVQDEEAPADDDQAETGASASGGSKAGAPNADIAEPHFFAENKALLTLLSAPVVRDRALSLVVVLDPSCPTEQPLTATCGGECMTLARYAQDAVDAGMSDTWNGREAKISARRCIEAYNSAFAQGAPSASANESAHAAQPKPAQVQTVAAPAMPSVAASDPVTQDCLMEGALNRLYDCACLGERAPGARDAWSDSQFAEQQKYLPYRRNALANAESALANESDPNRRASLERGIENAKAEIERLQTRPDPLSAEPAMLYPYLTVGGACRSGGALEEEQYGACIRSSPDATDPEAYCRCVGRAAAASWTDGAMAAFNSKTWVRAVADARRSCAK